MSSVGRKIQDEIFQSEGFTNNLRIGILEIPTGFEVNAIHAWPQRMQEFFEKSFKNYNPLIKRIRAWRKSGENSTDDPFIVDDILDQDCIYAGAGCPTYVVNQL